MPADHYSRARARIWIDFFNTRVHAAAHDLRYGKDTDKAMEKMMGHLKTLDSAMEGKEYLLGEYSLADVTFIPFYVRRDRYGVTIDDNLPNLRRWGEALIARPAVAATL
ncbi:MAG TPA: glutathione binding-like protein [candidate division Zixibacteria bacterium]|nr:glutathione binding-like protein [candidate division Zixibacteria bacterium]